MFDLSRLQLAAHPGQPYDASHATIHEAEETLSTTLANFIHAYVTAVDMAKNNGVFDEAKAREHCLNAVNTAATAGALVISTRFNNADDLNAIIKELYNAVEDVVFGWQNLNKEEINAN